MKKRLIAFVLTGLLLLQEGTVALSEEIMISDTTPVQEIDIGTDISSDTLSTVSDSFVIDESGETAGILETENQNNFIIDDIIVEDVLESDLREDSEYEEETPDTEKIFETESECDIDDLIVDMEEDASVLMLDDREYNASSAHVVINQVYGGGKKEAYVSNSFIELYNPTSNEIDLSSWSIQYRSSKDGDNSDAWVKHNLSGTIKSGCSYLIKCGAVANPAEGALRINSYDDFWDQVIHNKGFSVVLVSNQTLIDKDSVVFDNTTGKPAVDGYVDMLSASGNDGTEDQCALFAEGSASAEQSKKKTVRRVSFMDTDHNEVGSDTQVVDYSFANEKYIAWIAPRSSADGVWVYTVPPTFTVTYETNGGSAISSEVYPLNSQVKKPDDPVNEDYENFAGWFLDEALTQKYSFDSRPEHDIVLYASWLNMSLEKKEVLDALKELKEGISKYYEVYYTPYSSAQIKVLLDELEKDMDALPIEELQRIYTEMQIAIENLEYKTTEVTNIYISTSDGNGNSLEKGTGYVSTDIAIVYPDGTLLQDTNARIKVRGNSTAQAAKKPFNFKLSSKQDILGMGSAKKWTLLANCFDPTLMRNTLALNLAAKLGLAYTSQCRYVELWMDGVYKGCYLLTESVEAGDNRVEINVKNGDFMVEYADNEDGTEDGVYYLPSFARFEFKEPEEPTSSEYEYIKNVMDKFDQALFSGDYSKVTAMLDISSFAKLYLLNEYFRTYDIGRASVNFYYKDGKMYAGPAWDFDFSSGNHRSAAGYSTEGQYCNENQVFAALWEYEDFRIAVYEQYKQYSGILQSVYASEIDGLVNRYQNVFNRNFTDANWSLTEIYNPGMRTPDSTYAANVSYLKNWLSARLSWLSSFLFSEASRSDDNIDATTAQGTFKLSLVLPKKSCGVGDDFTISATLSSEFDSYHVIAYAYEIRTGKTSVIYDQEGLSGQFNIVWKPTKRGNYYIYANANATGTHRYVDTSKQYIRVDYSSEDLSQGSDDPYAYSVPLRFNDGVTGMMEVSNLCPSIGEKVYFRVTLRPAVFNSKILFKSDSMNWETIYYDYFTCAYTTNYTFTKPETVKVYICEDRVFSGIGSNECHLKAVDICVGKKNQTVEIKEVKPITYKENLQIQLEEIAAKTKVTYTSVDTSVATVDAGGLVTVKKPGKVVIHALAEENSEYAAASTEVSIIINKISQTVSANDLTLTYNAGKTGQIRASAKTSLTYTADKTKVVSVAADGKVTALKPGKAAITVTAVSDDYYEAAFKTIYITVKKAKPNITVSKQTITYKLNKKVYLDAKTTGGKLSYESSNKNVVIVNSKGRMTVKGIGSATITVTSAENDYYLKGIAKITVSVIPENVIVTDKKSEKKGCLTLQYNVVSGITGYEIQTSTSKKFKAAYTRTIKVGAAKHNVTIQRLPSGKRVYTRIRAYRKIGKNYLYGAWTTVSRTKIK